MNTAARPVGDNEFPVLLRLPDLNAPPWSSVGTVNLPLGNAPTVSSSTLNAEVPSAATKKALAAASTEAVAVAPTQPAQVETVSTLPRPAGNMFGDAFSPAKWSLVRQLTTGGVLVGSLVLGFLAMRGDRDQKTPAHIPVADTSVDPPVIEMPSHPHSPTTPKLKPSDVNPSPSNIAETTSPPTLDKKWNDNTVVKQPPSHIEVAETPRRDPVMTSPREVAKPDLSRETAKPTDPRASSGSRYEPTTGSNEAANNNPRYPTTDASKFHNFQASPFPPGYQPPAANTADSRYGPASNPAPNNTDPNARLHGNIVPAPRR